jgi:uncharacterized protein (TIGR03435 family)
MQCPRAVASKRIASKIIGISRLFGVALAAAAFGQAPAAPHFEVASIKPAPPDLMAQYAAGKLHTGMSVDGARVDIGAMTLADLICAAYRIRPYQLSGPDWMTANRFNILARIPDGVPKESVPEMLQALLVERFGLAIHHEAKDESVYALIIGKGGAKMEESRQNSDAPTSTGGATADLGQGPVDVKRDGKGGATLSGGPNGPMRMSPGPEGSTHYEFLAMSMRKLADFLSPMLDRPVAGVTGTTGYYQVSLDIPLVILRRRAEAAGFAPPAPPSASAPAEPSDDLLFESLQKMGLKLEKRKLPIDTIIVDRLERAPTGN